MNQSNICGNSKQEKLIYSLSTLLHCTFRYTMENSNLANSNMQLFMPWMGIEEWIMWQANSVTEVTIFGLILWVDVTVNGSIFALVCIYPV